MTDKESSLKTQRGCLGCIVLALFVVICVQSQGIDMAHSGNEVLRELTQKLDHTVEELRTENAQLRAFIESRAKAEVTRAGQRF